MVGMSQAPFEQISWQQWSGLEWASLEEKKSQALTNRLKEFPSRLGALSKKKWELPGKRGLLQPEWMGQLSLNRWGHMRTLHRTWKQEIFTKAKKGKCAFFQLGGTWDWTLEHVEQSLFWQECKLLPKLTFFSLMFCTKQTSFYQRPPIRGAKRLLEIAHKCSHWEKLLVPKRDESSEATPDAMRDWED